MRVLFVQESGIDESPILTEVSAWLRMHGHETTLRLRRNERHFFREIRQIAPDMILIPASVLAFDWTRDMAADLRRAYTDATIVLAGSLPTLVPESLNAISDADFALTGEIEYGLLALCDALEQHHDVKDTPNLLYRAADGRIVRNAPAPPFAELTSLPVPDRSLYFDRYPFMQMFPWKRLLAGRGCVYNCTFCYQPVVRRMHGSARGYVRYKNPEQCVAEAIDLAHTGITRHIHFGDDLFTCNLDWLSEFGQLYRREVGLPFSINTTADYVTEKSATLLADAGCASISIGIEAADNQTRIQGLGKNVTNQAIEAAAARLNAHGMHLITFNLLAHETDSPASILETIRFNAGLGTHFARAAICQPLPGINQASPGNAAEDQFMPNVHTMFNRVHYPHLRDQERDLVALFHAFTFAAAFPRWLPIIDRLARSRWAFLLKPLGIWRLFKEKSTYRLRWREAIRYFLAVGHPKYRTNNFADLVA